MRELAKRGLADVSDGVSVCVKGVYMCVYVEDGVCVCVRRNLCWIVSMATQVA